MLGSIKEETNASELISESFILGELVKYLFS